MTKTEFMEYLEDEFFLREGKDWDGVPYPGQSVQCPEKGVYVVQYLDKDSWVLKELRLILDPLLDPAIEPMNEREWANYPWRNMYTPRRPYFRMRGRPVTEEQAFDILRRTLRLPFEGFDTRNQDTLLEGRVFYDGAALDNSWLTAPCHGWIFPDGIVGMNGLTVKYPSATELIENVLPLQQAFPYLDLVLAFTDWNELPPYAVKAIFSGFGDSKFYTMENRNENEGLYRVNEDKVREMIAKEVFPDFLEHIEFGLWLHDGVLEVMASDRAREKYQEYNLLCGETDERRFTRHLYADESIPAESPIDMAYLRRIVSSFGLNPDKVLEGWSIRSGSDFHNGLVKDEDLLLNRY